MTPTPRVVTGTGGYLDSGSGTAWWAYMAAGLGLLLLGTAGVAAYRRLRPYARRGDSAFLQRRTASGGEAEVDLEMRRAFPARSTRPREGSLAETAGAGRTSNAIRCMEGLLACRFQASNAACVNQLEANFVSMNAPGTIRPAGDLKSGASAKGIAPGKESTEGSETMILNWKALRRGVLVAAVVALISSLMVASVSAQPPTPPNRFFGNVTGATAGASVAATIGGVTCGQTTVKADSTYVLDVVSSGQTAGCGTEGASVSFAVGGSPAGSGTWSSGKFTSLDLAPQAVRHSSRLPRRRP